MKKVKIFSVVVLLLVDIMMCEEDVRETETGLCAEYRQLQSSDGDHM